MLEVHCQGRARRAGQTEAVVLIHRHNSPALRAHPSDHPRAWHTVSAPLSITGSPLRAWSLSPPCTEAATRASKGLFQSVLCCPSHNSAPWHPGTARTTWGSRMRCKHKYLSEVHSPPASPRPCLRRGCCSPQVLPQTLLLPPCLQLCFHRDASCHCCWPSSATHSP